MKKFIFSILLVHTIGTLGALDLQSYDFIEYLLTLKAPSSPFVFDDAVIFTAPSTYRKVGIAFAHEDFAKIHWFKKLLIPIADTPEFDPESKIDPEFLKDSGILFCAYTPGETVQIDKYEYRLVIDGLWSADPLNPQKKFSSSSALELSVTDAPPVVRDPHRTNEEGVLLIKYEAPPGETITAAGDFNGWDPFMYPLTETSPGNYSIKIYLPKGKWNYVLFYRGQRVLDPENRDKVYSNVGTMANIITIQ
jgi:hypothetical protein